MQDWLAGELQGLPVSTFSALGLEGHAIISGFLHGFWELDSDPHACMTSLVLTEPSLQSVKPFVIF